jgi:hypothetical protein
MNSRGIFFLPQQQYHLSISQYPKKKATSINKGKKNTRNHSSLNPDHFALKPRQQRKKKSSPTNAHQEIRLPSFSPHLRQHNSKNKRKRISL